MVSTVFYDVVKSVTEYEEDILFDVEAPSHWYCVTYDNDKIILQEIDEYHYNGDEWGEICTKTNVCKIDEFECTLTEYVNFVIRFFNEKMLYVQHEYPQRNYVLTKIDVMYMEAIE